MVTIRIPHNYVKVIFYLAIALLLLLMLGQTGANLVGAKGATCVGTYLVDLDQRKGLWTFSSDGAVQVTDSAEAAFGISDKQGAWLRTGSGTARATWLDFIFDQASSEPLGYGRFDAAITFADNCNSIAGTSDLRTYGPTDDPLNPTGGTLLWDDLGFTGQRVNP